LHTTVLLLSNPLMERACKRAGSRIRTDDLLITNQLLYQLSYAGIYEGKPSILIHFFRPLYPPFVSLSQKRAQRADSVPLPLRTVRIPSEEASPFIKLARLRTLIDAG
jgi:hypothetical protein